MRTPKIRILQFFLLFFGIWTFGQFNTITPIKEEKQDFFVKENIQENQKSSNKKERTPLSGFFKNPTKSELKKQVDSLKMLLNLKKENKEYQNKINFKKIEDSLVDIIKSRISNNQEKNFQIQKNSLPNLPKISMPLKSNLKITSDFGMRFHPIFQTLKLHNGVDLRAKYVNVFAVLDGIVTESGFDENGGGNYIKILHSNRFETSYLHLSEIYYQKGEFVKAGFIIAKSGNSGNSTAPHLHFAVKEFGKFINPISFLNNLNQANQFIQNNYGYNTFANR